MNTIEQTEAALESQGWELDQRGVRTENLPERIAAIRAAGRQFLGVVATQDLSTVDTFGR